MSIPIKKVAVIGGGVAGILCSYLLQNKYEVTLFEKNDYLGGHTHTIVIPDGPDAGTPVDTGFIVLNNRTYPHLHQFLQQLEVPVRASDMSFGYYCEETNFQYAGTTLNGLLAQRSHLCSPRIFRLVRDLLRFNRQGQKDLRNGTDLRKLPLGQFLEKYRFSEPFIQDYLIPISSAIWSTSRREMFEFPTEIFIHFFENHGLLSLWNRPQWQTVVGGSFSYVRAFLQQFPGKVHLKAQIQSVHRTPEQVKISFPQAEPQFFDSVVFATHADQVLPLLDNPSEEEQKWLRCWAYQKNHTLLHTDTTILPPNKRAWASWNVIREKNSGEEHPVSMTYDMNRLQGLKTKRHYLVSLNVKHRIKPEHTLKEISYSHPTFTLESLDSREQLKRLNGIHRTYFVGSYFGYGFHEDAVRSSVEMVQQHFGVQG